jgi:hypothetical protein
MGTEGHRIIPQVYIKPSEGKDGNVRHLIHDCRGVVVPSDVPDRIKCLIDPSMIETLKDAARQDYVQKATIRWTTQTSEIIKG